MGVLERDISFSCRQELPPGFVLARINTAGFHTWGDREYLEFHPSDLAIPSSELQKLCAVLDSAPIGSFVTFEGYNWATARESHTVRITSDLLGVLSWQIALRVAFAQMDDQPSDRQRQIHRESLDRWAGGRWPFHWKRESEPNSETR